MTNQHMKESSIYKAFTIFPLSLGARSHFALNSCITGTETPRMYVIRRDAVYARYISMLNPEEN